MKRNAIARICVYGGLILLLLAILAVGIFGMSTGAREKYVMATVAPMSEAAVPVTAPVEVREVLATGITRAALNVYASPSVDAPVCGTMGKGTPVEVQIMETVSGEEWAYVWGVAPGWVQLPLLELDEQTQVPLETVAAEAVSAPEGGIGTATVTANMLNVRNAPSLAADSVGKLKKGDRVTVLEIQNAMDTSWAFVRWDDHGAWAMTEYLEMDAEGVPETTVTLLEEGEPGLRKFYQPISALDIAWPAGEVLVQSGDVEAVEVSYGEASVDITVTDKGRLKIHQEKALLNFQKHALVVTVPMDRSLEKVEVDGGSANVYIQKFSGQIQELEVDTASGKCCLENLTVGELEINTASGPCTLENLTVGQLDVDSASGKVTFTGSLDRLDFAGASAPFIAKIENCPQKLNLETLSANLDLTLPENCGHTVEFHGVRGKLSTEFETQSDGDSILYGDGGCKIKVETKSGWINIHKQ